MQQSSEDCLVPGSNVAVAVVVGLELAKASWEQMCQGLNSHYFHIIGDKLINPIVGVYIHIIRIPIKGGMTIPNLATFDHGTDEKM